MGSLITSFRVDEFFVDAELQRRHEHCFQIALRKSIPLGDLIYDVCWHPSNNCFATSSKDHPIHIWDAEGNRMHSFRGINHLVGGVKLLANESL